VEEAERAESLGANLISISGRRKGWIFVRYKIRKLKKHGLGLHELCSTHTPYKVTPPLINVFPVRAVHTHPTRLRLLLLMCSLCVQYRVLSTHTQLCTAQEASPRRSGEGTVGSPPVPPSREAMPARTFV
jgi:hypothetical protein